MLAVVKEVTSVRFFSNCDLHLQKKYDSKNDDDDDEEFPSVIRKKKNTGTDVSPLGCFDPKEIARQMTIIGIFNQTRFSYISLRF